MKRLFLVMALAACVPAGEGADDPVTTGGGTISFGNSGSITGYGVITVVGSDDLVSVQYRGYGAPADPAAVTIPGSFDRVVRILATEGVEVQHALAGQGDQLSCPDFGTDAVTATPAVAGFSGVSAGCPEDRVSALMSRLHAAVAE